MTAPSFSFPKFRLTLLAATFLAFMPATITPVMAQDADRSAASKTEGST